MTATSTAGLSLLSFALHHIDVASSVCALVPAPTGTSDLDDYLMELLGEVQGSPQNREYSISAPNTQFGNSLQSFHALQDLPQNPEASSLAQRLLHIEQAAEVKYGHLSQTGRGHIKKGSFLQCLYSWNGCLQYLAVKVEHQAFLDETDYLRKIGLGESQRVYKACAVSFDGQGLPVGFSIYDTNRKPSVYWWKDMLELVAKRDDEENTKTAIAEVVRVLNSIKKTSPVDYTLLRNAAVTAFKQSGVMKFDDFVTGTFQNYVPQEPALAAKWSKTVDKLRSLPSTRRFDGQFNLVPSAVPFKRLTVKLSPQVSLNYDEGILNLSDKIWSTTTPDGRNVVVVDAPDTAGLFEHKTW